MENTTRLRGRRSQTGFTLIELIIVIVVGAILMAVAVPSFTEFLKQGELTTQTNDFLGAINIARSEAIKRSAPVTVCASDDNSATVPTCGGASWDDGWILFTDPDSDLVVDAGEVLITSHDPFNTSSAMAGTATFFQYLSRGSIAIPGGAAEIKITSAVGGIDNSRCITLNSAGRPVVEPTACP